MNPIEDVRLSRIARNLPHPISPAIPRGLHRKECYIAMNGSWNKVFTAWLNDDLSSLESALAGLMFDVLDTAAVYGIDLGEAWKREVESR